MSKWSKLAMTAGAVGVLGAAGSFGTFAAFTDGVTGPAGSVETGTIKIGGGVNLANITNLGTDHAPDSWTDAGTIELTNAGSLAYKFQKFQVNMAFSGTDGEELADRLRVRVTPYNGANLGQPFPQLPLSQLNTLLTAGNLNNVVGADGIAPGETQKVKVEVRLPEGGGHTHPSTDNAVQGSKITQTFDVQVSELHP